MIVYISGKYTAPDRLKTLENIMYAEKFAVKVWEAGHFAFCPHLNTRLFEDKCKIAPDTYIKADLMFLERCDAILMIPNWKDSSGAKIEHEFAEANGIPIYYDVRDVPCPTT